MVEDLHDSKVKSSEAQVLIFKNLAKCLAERRDVEFVAQENEGALNADIHGQLSAATSNSGSRFHGDSRPI